MANKRMFSNMVIDSDLFLDLPPMAQLLYFHCGMKTDDDGFIYGARRIARIIGASDDDFKTLIDKGFLIEFPDSKVFVIVHHRQNNDLKNDRYHPTNYQQEFIQLELTENKEWRLREDVSKMETDCIQSVSNVDTEHNVTHRNPKNVTQINGEEGSDEGRNITTTGEQEAMLIAMADKAHITYEVKRAIAEHGFDTAYKAFKAWKDNGAIIGRYKGYLKEYVA